MTRAERREQQERQRAEKAARQAAAKQVSKPSKPATTPRSQGSSAVNTPTRAQSGKGAPEPPAPREQGGLALFSHLPPPRHMDVKAALQRTRGDVHPSIVRLGLDYANGAVRGADARCVAMLEAFREVVKDYRVPEGKTLQRDLVAHLSVNVGFLVEARPLGTAMGNAIKYLKTYVTHLDGHMDEGDAREAVLDTIDSYIRVRTWWYGMSCCWSVCKMMLTTAQDKVLGCCKVLVDKARDTIADGDVVLTFAMSSVVLKLLLAAKADGKQFRVVVADARPLLEGREMLRRLLAAGVGATYCLTSGLAYIMREVTKVFVGASAVLSNGRGQQVVKKSHSIGQPQER